MKKTNKFYGTLDRIEGNTAVVLAGEDGDTVEISKALLPPDSREGDLISFKLEIKDKKTKDEKEKIEGLIRKLAK
jgi:hypothetical protein